MSDFNMSADEVLRKYGFDMYASAEPARAIPQNKMISPTPSFMPENPALAMAYVPMQLHGQTYEPEKGLMAGTIFPDLDKPFLGRWNN